MRKFQSNFVQDTHEVTGGFRHTVRSSLKKKLYDGLFYTPFFVNKYSLKHTTTEHNRSIDKDDHIDSIGPVIIDLIDDIMRLLYVVSKSSVHYYTRFNTSENANYDFIDVWWAAWYHYLDMYRCGKITHGLLDVFKYTSFYSMRYNRSDITKINLRTHILYTSSDNREDFNYSSTRYPGDINVLYASNNRLYAGVGYNTPSESFAYFDSSESFSNNRVYTSMKSHRIIQTIVSSVVLNAPEYMYRL